MSNDCGDEFPEPERPESDDVDADDIVDPVDVEIQKRLWVRALLPVLQLAPPDVDADEAVARALNRLRVVAADRLTRILRSDINEH